jgi:hypothetical protein
MDDSIEPAPTKIVIALMGEFSSGKSTLANLLLGGSCLPVQVIATQLPPVWIKYGEPSVERVDINGQIHSLELDDLKDVCLEDTHHIKLYRCEDILKQCELIDMPGISDPNMTPDIWERLLPEATSVFWCTPATQAWRQSEAAVWEEVPKAVYEQSLLLVTRFDKLNNQVDRDRVLKRIKRETSGLFKSVLPLSLLQATQVTDDYDLWAQSGAEELANSLADIIAGPMQSDPISDQISPCDSGATTPSALVCASGPKDPNAIVPRRIHKESIGERRHARPTS